MYDDAIRGTVLVCSLISLFASAFFSLWAWDLRWKAEKGIGDVPVGLDYEALWFNAPWQTKVGTALLLLSLLLLTAVSSGTDFEPQVYP